MADISAKENAQETAVNVCGMVSGWPDLFFSFPSFRAYAARREGCFLSPLALVYVLEKTPRPHRAIPSNPKMLPLICKLLPSFRVVCLPRR